MIDSNKSLNNASQQHLNTESESIQDHENQNDIIKGQQKLDSENIAHHFDDVTDKDNLNVPEHTK